MKETNPVWIDFYKKKLPKLLLKMDNLDPENRMYWPKRLALSKQIKQIKVKLGMKP
jgi:hypothetical protein